MRAVGLPLFVLVAAAPAGSMVEGYGVYSEKDWVKTAGRVMQYVSSASLIALATDGAVRAVDPVLTLGGAGIGLLHLAIPAVQTWVFPHRDLDLIAGVLLKFSSTIALIITAYAISPLALAPIGCHFLPYILAPSKMAGYDAVRSQKN